jgi:hypothetical protein
MGKAKEREDFLVMLMANCPKGTYGEVLFKGRELLRLAKRYHRLQEQRGNVGLTDKENRQEERIEKKISDLCHDLNPAIQIILGGDYRGYTTKLLLPGGQYNTWGGNEDGWGVPV